MKDVTYGLVDIVNNTVLARSSQSEPIKTLEKHRDHFLWCQRQAIGRVVPSKYIIRRI